MYREQAIHLIWGADRGKYTLFIDKLRDSLLKGNNNYPAAVSEAYRILLHYRNDTKYYSGNIQDVEAHSFAKNKIVDYSKNKKLCGRRKRRVLQGGKSDGGPGGDSDDTSTIKTVEPPLLVTRCFCRGILGHYHGEC